MLRLPVATLAARKSALCALAIAVIFALALASSPAFAEVQASLYGGWNGSFDSDIHLIQPNGTNMTLNDVPWDGDSFGPPPIGDSEERTGSTMPRIGASWST